MNSVLRRLREREETEKIEIRDLANTNDSILSVIATSNGKIDTIKYTYEKEFINITNQPIANDVVFFTEYLSEVGK